MMYFDFTPHSTCVHIETYVIISFFSVIIDPDSFIMVDIKVGLPALIPCQKNVHEYCTVGCPSQPATKYSIQAFNKSPIERLK